MTIVEADAVYVKPFETDTILITPGQTTNVLLKTHHNPQQTTFAMVARPYFTGQGTFDNSTIDGILMYDHNLPGTISSSSNISIKNLPIPTLPPINSTSFVANFTNKFRSLASAKFPANVPQNVDKHFFLP
ncbi:hypothetical protein RND71_014267 [Anisodus tanguticus]|uniref:Plastocyanin-like domain-containing protein n=1 Tax=Anisodus tanguticus TaxID=243964 RepID=A0AAE1SB11_9SOLA|nr:hypothetical protein RND71_014267 [Anisodus tanguticus]